MDQFQICGKVTASILSHGDPISPDNAIQKRRVDCNLISLAIAHVTNRIVLSMPESTIMIKAKVTSICIARIRERL